MLVFIRGSVVDSGVVSEEDDLFLALLSGVFPVYEEYVARVGGCVLHLFCGGKEVSIHDWDNITDKAIVEIFAEGPQEIF